MCKRLCQLCLAPELLRSVQLGEEGPMAMPRCEELVDFLAQHAQHVRRLTLHLQLSKGSEAAAEPAEDELLQYTQLRAAVGGCLAACAASSSSNAGLEELVLSGATPAAQVDHWLPHLPRLQELWVGRELEALALPPAISCLSALRELGLRGSRLLGSLDELRLPLSLTRLQVTGHLGSEVLEHQVRRAVRWSCTLHLRQAVTVLPRCCTSGSPDGRATCPLLWAEVAEACSSPWAKPVSQACQCVSLPCPAPQLARLTNLQALETARCGPGCDAAMAAVTALSGLHTLHIDVCDPLLPGWLPTLTRLRQLVVSGDLLDDDNGQDPEAIAAEASRQLDAALAPLHQLTSLALLVLPLARVPQAVAHMPLERLIADTYFWPCQAEGLPFPCPMLTSLRWLGLDWQVCCTCCAALCCPWLKSEPTHAAASLAIEWHALLLP